MPQYSIYLISSLPMLHFGARPPFSFESFLRLCEGLIADEDMVILKASSLSGEYPPDTKQPALKKWRGFDTALRNELVKVRSSRRHLDAGKYLRKDGYGEPSVTSAAVNASRTPSIIEAEKVLGRARWAALEEMSVGHYFDIDALIVYAHKLLMLERWERIEMADKPKKMEELLALSQRKSV